MKKTLTVILTAAIASSIAIVFISCGKDKWIVDTTPENIAEVPNTDKTERTEEISNLAYENMTAQDLLKDIKDTQNITTDELLTLLESYKYVEIDDRFNKKDNITDEAFRLLRDKNAHYHDITELLEKGSQSREQVVRAEVLKFMLTISGIKDEHKEIALRLLKTEEDPYVLYTLVKVFGNELSNPDIAEFTFKMSEHENPAIRDKAAYAIASPWSKEVDGTVERLIEMMEDDDKEVRKTVYKNAGRLGDERIIAPIVKTLMDPEQYDFHSNCMESLAALWINFPEYENISEKAYRATIDYYEITPRNENVPYWSAINTIAKAKPKLQDDKFQIWKEKASFYNPDELINPMFDILRDPKVHWLACNSAIDLVQRHGTKEQFDSIKHIIELSEHPEKDTILNSYNEKAAK